MTPARKRVLETAADGLCVVEERARRGGGRLARRHRRADRRSARSDMSTSRPARSPPIPIPTMSRRPSSRRRPPPRHSCARRSRDGFSVSLLDGVTGSGKTEVYFEAVAETLRAGHAGADPPAGDRADRRHSSTASRRASARARRNGIPSSGAKRRARVWRAVAQGEVQAVVGARSALFLPFPDLGLIVVDEEHDPAYKQEEGVTYHARDMAIVRAKLGGFPIVLSSATPSVESRVNAERGRYRHLRLPARFGGADGAGGQGDRSARRAAGARPLALAAAGRGDRRRPSPPASRRSSSSTGAAMRR